MPVKILRIINRFNLGGPTFNAAYLTKYLPSDKYETLLVGGTKTESEAGSEFILNELGVEYRIIKSMSREVSLKNDYKAYKEICSIIEEYKPDIVHTHASKAGLLGRLAAKKYKVPVVVHTFHGHVFHSYFGKLKTNFYINIERFLAKHTSKIIAISEIQKKELSQEFRIAPESKFTVIPLGFDLSRFLNAERNYNSPLAQKYDIQPDTVNISIVGRLVPIKNHKLFIEAVALLKNKTTKKIRAFIVGDGELREELENFTQSLNLKTGNDNSCDITFTSWITQTQEIYSLTDIVALSSLNEGTPVSLIEAQASACPIVTTNAGGVKDIVFENESTLIAEHNAEDFSAKLLKIIENQKFYSDNAEKVKSKISQKFGYQRLVNDIDGLYTSLSKK